MTRKEKGEKGDSKTLKNKTCEASSKMYDLELDNLIEKINKEKARRIVIQLPDGLKNRSREIVEEVELRTNAILFIWFGSCYGGCDIPLGTESAGIDLIVQWGHNKFLKEDW